MGDKRCDWVCQYTLITHAQTINGVHNSLDVLHYSVVVVHDSLNVLQNSRGMLHNSLSVVHNSLGVLHTTRWTWYATNWMWYTTRWMLYTTHWWGKTGTCPCQCGQYTEVGKFASRGTRDNGRRDAPPDIGKRGSKPATKQEEQSVVISLQHSKRNNQW